MGAPGIGELILIFAVALLLFGGKRLPELGGAIGESLKNLKRGLREGAEERLVEPGEPKPAQRLEASAPPRSDDAPKNG